MSRVVVSSIWLDPGARFQVIRAKRIRVAITVMIVLGVLFLSISLLLQDGSLDDGYVLGTIAVIVAFFSYFIYAVWKLFT